jgi:hypothetical protein
MDSIDVKKSSLHYRFSSAKLNSFGGNFVQAEMVRSFLLSDEYRHRFGLN